MHGLPHDALTWTQMQAALDEAQHAAALARDELAAHLAKHAAPIAQRDAAVNVVYWLLRDFPELRRSYCTHDAQHSLRAALALLVEAGRPLP